MTSMKSTRICVSLRPFKAETGVRIPVGTPFRNSQNRAHFLSISAGSERSRASHQFTAPHENSRWTAFLFNRRAYVSCQCSSAVAPSFTSAIRNFQMRYLICVALLCAGCEMSQSPTSPTPPPPPVFTQPVQPVRVSVAPFTATLSTGDTLIKVGLWRVTLEVRANINELQPEPPTQLRFTCANDTTTRPVGLGTLLLPCTFPAPGDYTVTAIVSAASGYESSSQLRVTVASDKPAPDTNLRITFDVLTSSTEFTETVFTVRDFPVGSQYLWDFGDNSTQRTLLGLVKHRYETPTRERRVRLTVRSEDGNDVLGSGSVVGIW